MARGDWRGDEWPNPFVQRADVSRVLSIAIHWIRLEPWRGPFPACDSSSEERIGFLDSISISSIRFPSYFFSPDFVLFFSTRLWFLEFEERGELLVRSKNCPFFFLWKNCGKIREQRQTRERKKEREFIDVIL